MDLIVAFTLLVLALFLGVELISKVSPTLHTPLMSGSNAISGITLIGAITAISATEQNAIATVLSFAAITLATINVVGGFLVTHRMLHMFSPKRKHRQHSQQNPEKRSPTNNRTSSTSPASPQTASVSPQTEASHATPRKSP
ncbi:MAG: NAD(P) transhydrogenase subunit alpha [Acidimicrobiaceae bacterium]|nr:NAD(P) transhydrogenase subunit alpha [Acidimicrobiaceae bacterium]